MTQPCELIESSAREAPSTEQQAEAKGVGVTPTGASPNSSALVADRAPRGEAPGPREPLAKPRGAHPFTLRSQFANDRRLGTSGTMT